MHVTDIPFNQFLGIRRSPAGGSALSLEASSSYLNHLGTVHAAAQLALAEAASGQILLEALPELLATVVAVVRRVEAKFKSPMRGAVGSRAATTLDEIRAAAEPLGTKGRAILPVTIEIVDDRGAVGLVATFEWFASRR
jgi:acyl-coenzyme A thioesterase PaaI-like protein